MSASPTWLADALPRLLVVDQSTSFKPDNYRVSPVTPTSPGSTSVFQDWSGRGSHVDFAHNEKPPLKEGRCLGQGVMGPVYETFIRGHAFAWKRRYCRTQIGDAEKKEIEILKKLSHTHIIQLVGTYTWNKFLGLLLYPVAECDLHTFFEDFEAIASNEKLDSTQQARMSGLGLPSTNFKPWLNAARPFLISKIGCMTSAVEYLHSQKVRHKDLKPSNILLSQDQLWLTDFGSATDFSQLTGSHTENGERGTPKYFAPEVAAFESSGRPADIFSLGCVLLEIHVLVGACSLQALKDLRTERDLSFQANLDKTLDWFSLNTRSQQRTGHSRHLATEILQMLCRDAKLRPTASELRKLLCSIDTHKEGNGLFFGKCCQTSFISTKEHDAKMDSQRQDFLTSIQRLVVDQRLEITRLQQELDAFKTDASVREKGYGADLRTWRKEYLNSDDKSALIAGEGNTSNSVRRKPTFSMLRTGNQVLLEDEENTIRKDTKSPESTLNSDENYHPRQQREFERSGRATPRDRPYDDVRRERESERREGRIVYTQDELLEYQCQLCDNVYQLSSHLRQHMRKRHEVEMKGGRHSNENMRKKHSAEAMRRRHSSNLLRRSSSQRIIGE